MSCYSLAELGDYGAEKIFELAAEWGVSCDNCGKSDICTRNIVHGFCSDFTFRNDDACGELFDKLWGLVPSVVGLTASKK